jgi:hypothetical protein
MYEISVPIMCSTIKRGNRERLVSELKRFGTKRVFVSLDKYETDEVKRREVMEELSENCKFFAENGFEVGSWIWTFWLLNNTKFRNMRSIKGTEIKDFMCPTDEKFLNKRLYFFKITFYYVYINSGKSLEIVKNLFDFFGIEIYIHV